MGQFCRIATSFAAFTLFREYASIFSALLASCALQGDDMLISSGRMFWHACEIQPSSPRVDLHFLAACLAYGSCGLCFLLGNTANASGDLNKLDVIAV